MTSPAALASALPSAVSELSLPQGCNALAPNAVASTCRYAGKRCFNPRAVKRNGSLHNLCHYHRVRANQNQRRMELRRRIQRSREDHGVDAMLPAYLAVPPSDGYTAALLHTDLTTAPLNANWSYYDVLSPVMNANMNANANAPLLPAALPPHDHLSDLFTAPPRDHYVIDMLLSPPALHKSTFEGSMTTTMPLHHQPPLFPAAFPIDTFQYAAAPEMLQQPASSYSPFGSRSAVFPNERHDVVWCDQELLL